MAIIRYIEDPIGTQFVLQLIQQIARNAHQEESYRRLAGYIAQALEYLEYTGVPFPPELMFQTTDVDDPIRPLTFHLLKKLKRHPPLLEFRVNQRPLAFRAIFFYDLYQDGQYQPTRT